MSFGYWFVNTFCWINFIGGVILGGLGWKKYGNKIEEIWKNISK